MVSEFRNEPLLDFNKPDTRRSMEAALAGVLRETGREIPIVIGGEYARRTTRSPGLKFFTKSPTCSTIPTASWPITFPKDAGRATVSIRWTSVVHGGRRRERNLQRHRRPRA